MYSKRYGSLQGIDSQAISKWIERNTFEVAIGPVHHCVVSDRRDLGTYRQGVWNTLAMR